MRGICRTVLVVLIPALFLTWMPSPAAAAPGIYYVSEFSPIEDGNVVRAQAAALKLAKETAVKKALMDLFPEYTYRVLRTYLTENIVPGADIFVTNYKIDNQDISDLAYTINLTVRVDMELLRKQLTRVGLIKVPGSPPLASVFVTLDVPLTLDQANYLGHLADSAFSSKLSSSGITVIPIPVEEVEEETDTDTGIPEPEAPPAFRVIRPPQTPKTLLNEGIAAMTDLAVGVAFVRNGEIEETEDGKMVPVKLSALVIDTGIGEAAMADSREVTLLMRASEKKISGEGLSGFLDELSSSVAAELKSQYVDRETVYLSYNITVSGILTSFVIRELNYRLKVKLGENASILPAAYTRERVDLVLYTARSQQEVVDILNDLELTGFNLEASIQEDMITVTMNEDPEAVRGVVEYGLDVSFYKRIPVPGLENPEDLKKTEFVPWTEQEENGTIYTANIAPVGMAIIGKMNYPQDHDFYHFLLPDKTNSVAYRVELTGPDEQQSRVRVFTSSGELISDNRASRRGRNLYKTFKVEKGTQAVILSVEDYLGRHKSLFSYVLNLDARVK